MALVEGMAEFRARLASFSSAARTVMADAVHKGADEFAAAARAAAPVSELEAHPGDLRAGIQKHDGSNELKKVVSSDAKDEEGHYYAAHVELGHKARDGRPVPAQPSFLPAWRLTKKRIMSRIQRSIRAAAKAETDSGG